MTIHAVDWDAPAKVKAFFTDRVNGVSQGPYQGFNLAQHVGDDAAHVQSNRDWLNQRSNCSLAWLDQTHSCHSIEISSSTNLNTALAADASFSRQPGFGCVVMTADCLPILICDQNATVVSAIHAGWRGLANGIVEQTLAKIAYPNANFSAWIGPAIGPKRFEVGAEVKQVFVNTNPQASLAFKATNADKYLANLPLLAEQKLQQLGIKSIFQSQLCSFDDTRFYSYRREPVTGRFASLIYLEK
ncbi:peptidoglycan editing factor PgeF [Alginatibacterium sediminis]|uniref:Purine nucleoside phosphorylase n=1 Tax=Alginatibacterium sediminis TaxID=2164068 RepID=A0A420EJT6_9ALTE|nr:peptidoglycan editing factor PgeF [Alginatibacterium sediminis]RKF20934.1 peptidoglycan editing factor PgeF [Alginatibacterium sediminis]